MVIVIQRSLEFCAKYAGKLSFSMLSSDTDWSVPCPKESTPQFRFIGKNLNPKPPDSELYHTLGHTTPQQKLNQEQIVRKFHFRTKSNWWGWYLNMLVPISNPHFKCGPHFQVFLKEFEACVSQHEKVEKAMRIC